MTREENRIIKRVREGRIKKEMKEENKGSKIRPF
jgi:hypothetical protein